MGWGRTPIGITPLQAAVAAGATATTFSMNTVNNCVSQRFLAPDTRNVSSVWINWSAVGTAGTVQVRIETDNGSGKPSGTLYDANASVNITPTTGWQQCTFATTPTTNLVANSLYHIVIIVTATQVGALLRSSWTPSGGGYPVNSLTATDGSTRTNLVENSSSVPIGTVVLTDGTTPTEETVGFASFATSSNFSVYGTRAASSKFVVPSGVTLSALGVVLELPLRNGTPDDLRVRIFTSGNAVVSGSTVILAKGGLLSASGKRLIARFAAAVSLAAGTYRIVVDQSSGGGASATTSGNNWSLYNAVHRTSALAASYFNASTTPDDSVGSPTWTDTATDSPLIGLQLNDASAPGGSYTAASNVRNGTDRGDGTLGTLVVPAAGNVLSGTTFDNGTAGTATLPTAAQVLNGINYGASGTSLTGNVTLPTVANVRNGITFGASLGSTGTLVLPGASSVLNGVGFGAAGTEFSGNVTLPAAGDVESGITFGAALAQTGTFVVPTTGNVSNGVGYGDSGTEFTGTLVGGAAGALMLGSDWSGGYE